MTGTAVIDSSAVLTWLFDDSDLLVHEVELIQSSRFVVPPLWRLEVVNAVLSRERRRLITPDEVSSYVASLSSLGARVVQPPLIRDLKGFTDLARQHQLTSYDAVYLALAQHLSLPLYTKDKNLQIAATRSGVPLVLGN